MRKPVHFIRADVLERRSAELLARHAARFGPIERFPVPIEPIIEGTLELAISWEELPAQDGLVLGALRPALRTVVVNELARDYFGEFPGSESFTFAHEAAPWALHIDAGLVGQPTLGWPLRTTTWSALARLRVHARRRSGRRTVSRRAY